MHNSMLEYAQVQKMLGYGRVILHCYDNVIRAGLIRGSMRKRVWIHTVSTHCENYYQFPLSLFVG
jgi:initiation factor 1A